MKMTEGTLEVVLKSAKSLNNTDFLSDLDAYAILSYKTQEKKSKVASGEGTTPEWNQTFLFTITDDVTPLRIKLMDKDRFTEDDYLGESKISLRSVFEEGKVPPIAYNVVNNGKYCGELRVGLKFTRKVRNGQFLEENFGGWTESSRNHESLALN